MQFTLVHRDADLDAVREALDGCREFALDCEAAGFHRYRDTLCLVQLSTPTEHFIIDPLEVDPSPVLKGPLENPDVEVVMHGADFDMRLISRDLGLIVRGLYDTQVAAALTGEPQVGLSALLEKYLDVKLSKKYQRADWAKRPLDEAMLAYAISDTAHLVALRNVLEAAVREANRVSWVAEELEVLQNVRWEGEDETQDPVTRVKNARKLAPRALDALRTALQWRDEIARAMDRAPFRVAGDTALVGVAKERPDSLDALRNVKGMPRGVVERYGSELLSSIAELAKKPESQIEGFPRMQGNGVGRPTPEEEERFDRLKAARNTRADELGLDRGRVFSNASLMEVARQQPQDLDGILGLDVARRWQVEAVGPALLASLTPPQPLP